MNMVGATDWSGVALVVVAVGTTTAAILGAISTYRINLVHKEVRTFNESTLGQLGAASETRRVEELPHDVRTAQEQRHVDTAPPVEPPQGPAR